MRAATALAVLVTLAGAAAAVVAGPDFLQGANSAGIPRAVPTAVSLVLVLAALATWRPGFPFRLLSLHWALGSVAFARPGLRLALPSSARPWVEHVADGAMLGAFVVVVGLGLFAIVVQDARAVRLAVAGAAGSWVALLFALSLPPDLALDGGAYLLIFAAVGLACRAALFERISP